MKQITEVPENEISTRRTLKGTREQVFKAWSRPEYLTQWWGPNGFSITTEEFTFAPQGDWKFVMHSPDGQDYKNHIVYQEIDAPAGLIMDHVSGPFFTVVATFTQKGNETEVFFRQIFKDQKTRDQVAQFAVEGNRQIFDRLSQLLSQL